MTTLFSPLIVEFKRGSITDEGIFEGYCSTFGGEPDTVGDIIQSGAFTEALSIHKAAGTMPGLLWSHNLDEPIGRWLDLREDSKGLLGRGKLTLETRRGREALALLKDEACSLSIGFAIAAGGEFTKSGVRTITKVARLFEVSIVAIPANHRARITNVKIDSPRSLERFLRDSGLSNREAKRITSGGYSTFARDERTEIDLLNMKVDHLTQLIESKIL
jgi:HK97 family phage prohead protease